jgi:hypothetical protein
MSEDGQFLSIDQLEATFNISKNIMKFNSIIYKDMYLLLIRNNIVLNGQKKWEDILALGLDEMKWKEIFKLPFIVTQNTKLQ